MFTKDSIFFFICKGCSLSVSQSVWTEPCCSSEIIASQFMLPLLGQSADQPASQSDSHWLQGGSKSHLYGLLVSHYSELSNTLFIRAKH